MSRGVAFWYESPVILSSWARRSRWPIEPDDCRRRRTRRRTPGVPSPRCWPGFGATCAGPTVCGELLRRRERTREEVRGWRILGPTLQVAKHIKGTPKTLLSGWALRPSSLRACASISASCELASRGNMTSSRAFPNVQGHHTGRLWPVGSTQKLIAPCHAVGLSRKQLLLRCRCRRLDDRPCRWNLLL